MELHGIDATRQADDYLFGRGQAWFAFAMTIGLMIFDYLDRQVIVSLFPYLKAEWGPSDKQLGALVSVVSITVALGAIPVALFADRASRVKSVVVMAVIWSLASISCMFTRAYGQLLSARAFVGLGEAGYGSVGAALIASHFPARMRAAVLAAFFASASIGSVLGVMLGGLIATRWGWQAAFGVVGFPGLLMALLYLKVRDYRTVDLTPALDKATRSLGETVAHIAKMLAQSRTMLWVCIGAAAQLIVVSAVWSWLPSFLNRVHGMAPAQAGMRAALVVLCGAIGSVIWGAVVDRAGMRRSRTKFSVLALLCLIALTTLMFAFGAPQFGVTVSAIDAICADRARRLPDDLYGRASFGDCHRRGSPRRARHRLFGAGPVSESARPRLGPDYRRHAVGRLGARAGANRNARIRGGGGHCVPGSGAQL